MRYVSEERMKLLLGYLNNYQDSPEKGAELRGLKAGISTLIEVECKELPQEQWKTIDEFKASPVNGWCFVAHSDKVPMMNFFNKSIFYTDETCHKKWVGTITHVMPIKTPEPPK